MKHAAHKAELLLTAEERVTAAIEGIRVFHRFTKPEQNRWRDLIGPRLIERLNYTLAA